MYMLLLVFETAIPGTKPLQTYILDRTASSFDVVTKRSFAASVLTHKSNRV